jgi:hypothetical protein
MTDKEIPVIDVKTKVAVEDGKRFLVHAEQEIPDWYLKQLEDARTESKNSPAKDFHRIASIPAGIVDKWKREGFDVFTEKPEAIVKRLQAYGYSKLMATSKRIYK